MRIKSGFEIRNICGENIIIAHGVENIDFTKVITLNETAAFLWNKMQDKDFTEDELVDVLLEKYEVDEEVAQKDVKELIQSWIEVGLIHP